MGKLGERQGTQGKLVKYSENPQEIQRKNSTTRSLSAYIPMPAELFGVINYYSAVVNGPLALTPKP